MICSCPKCNASYDLKDELVGKNLECPNCKAQFIANPGNPPGTTSMNSAEKNLTEKWIFGKNKYGIKQKKIAINEKYYIKDEENNDLFFSVRRIHFWRRVGAILLGIIVLIGSIFRRITTGWLFREYNSHNDKVMSIFSSGSIWNDLYYQYCWSSMNRILSLRRWYE